ncbi:MAG: hypothetical protein RLZZ30_760 [Bacteroidota bacterium]
MDKIKFYVLFALVSSFLFSCAIEEAKPLSDRKLVIASDFLKEKDVRLFRAFSKESHVKVEIHHMTADSISTYLKKAGFNANIDLVFIRSLMGVKTLEHQSFQEVEPAFLSEQGIRLHPIIDHWFAAGVDPFVISYLPDSLDKPASYRELSTDFLWTSPNFRSLTVLKAQAKLQLQSIPKKNRKKTPTFKEWSRGLKDHRINYVEGDSTASTQLLLLTYHDYLSNAKLVRSKKRVVVFPTKTYVDYFGFAIVPQAKHYPFAKRFLSYWNEHAENARFLRRFGMRPSALKQQKKARYISAKKILEAL